MSKMTFAFFIIFLCTQIHWPDFQINCTIQTRPHSKIDSLAQIFKLVKKEETERYYESSSLGSKNLGLSGATYSPR